MLNEKLLDVPDVLGDDVTQDQAFAHANDVLKNAVGGISDMHGLVNVDFEDVKTVMSEPGKAMVGTAQAGGPDRATKAAEAAVACPLLESIGLSRARPQAAPLTVVQPSTLHGQRTGTDNLPILNHVLATPQQGIGGTGQVGKPDYGNLSTPSVWRSARSHASAKVEALSSNGMDEIEIPAFLGKQAGGLRPAVALGPTGALGLKFQTWGRCCFSLAVCGPGQSPAACIFPAC